MSVPGSDQREVFQKEGRLMFGQVREDSRVDLHLLQQIKEPKRIFVVASGGCTAFSLLSAGSCRIDALDISRAQVALVELKLEVFKQLGFAAGFDACTSDARIIYDKVSSGLTSDARSILEPLRESMKNGLNTIGWVDQTMRRLTGLFYLLVHSRQTTRQFLGLTDTNEQTEFYRKNWCNPQWRAAMKVGFNRRFLALVHGRAAMQLVPSDFSAIMEHRLERALTKFANRDNPYLWQAFFAQYPGSEDGYPPYLQNWSSEKLIANLAGLHLGCEDALHWLSKQDANSIDYFGMSNILELLPAPYADALIPELIRCGRTGTIVCVRSIFPKHDRRTLSDKTGAISFDRELSDMADDLDRSLFCNFYEVYRHS